MPELRDKVLELANNLLRLAHEQVDSSMQSVLTNAAWDMGKMQFVTSIDILASVEEYLKWASDLLEWRAETARIVSETLVQLRELDKQYRAAAQ